MVVGAAADQIEALGHEGLRQGGGVFENLLLVGFELRLHRLPQGHGLGGDDVLQGTTLAARENGGVDFLGQRLLAEDHAAPGAAEGLVGSGGHYVGIRHRGGVEPHSHQASDMGHIHKQIGSHLVGDIGKGLEVDGARIGGGAGQEHAGPVLFGQIAHLVVVDVALVVDAISHDIIVFSREVDR